MIENLLPPSAPFPYPPFTAADHENLIRARVSRYLLQQRELAQPSDERLNRFGVLYYPWPYLTIPDAQTWERLKLALGLPRRLIRAMHDAAYRTPGFEQAQAALEDATNDLAIFYAFDQFLRLDEHGRKAWVQIDASTRQAKDTV